MIEVNYDSIMVFKKDVNFALSQLISQHAKAYHLEAGQVFIQPGDTVRRVLYMAEGKFRSYSLNEDGLERVIYILSPGHFMGEGTFVKNNSNDISARFGKAETDCLIYWIDQDDYSILIKHQVFVDGLLKSSYKKNAFFRHEMENTLFLSLSDRLKNLLIASVDHDTLDHGWYSVSTQFTQNDMACILGANRVTISKVIKKLCEDKFMRQVNRKIQIHSDHI